MILQLLNLDSQLNNLLSKGMSFDSRHTSPQMVATRSTLVHVSDKQLQDNVMARLMLPVAPVADIPGMTPKMSPY